MTVSLRLFPTGDVVAPPTGIETVAGLNKLLQDLDLWLRERFGIDRFNPNYGSILPEMIGMTISDETNDDIRAEVIRLLSNYQQIQNFAYQAHPDMFDEDQILAEVVGVTVQQNFDTVIVSVTIRTLSALEETMRVIFSTEGATP